MNGAETNTPWALPVAAACLGAVLLGFSGTYLLPMTVGRFDGGAVFHIHGALFFSWFALLIVQSTLVRAGHVSLHVGLGLLGVVLALAMLASALTIEVTAAREAFTRQQADRAAAGLLLTVSNALLFAILFASAIAATRWPGVHRRLMILAALSIVPIAVQRLFFAVGVGGIAGIAAAAVLVDAVIVGLAIADARRRGSLHPAFGIGFVLILGLQAGRILLLGTPLWADATESLVRTCPLKPE